METFLAQFGLTVAELVRLAIITAVLLVGLFFLRAALRLTATLVRLGCVGIALIVAAIFVMSLL